MVLVIDASIVIKWIKNLGEKDTERALVYYEKLRKKEIDVAVPDLIFYELSNFASRQANEAHTVSCEMIDHVFDLDLEIVPPNQPLTQEATTLAHDLGMSAYDATYLTIARRLGTKLVTADQKLLAKAPELTMAL